MANLKTFEELINKLKSRNNKSYNFFQQLQTELNDSSQNQEAIKKLRSCFSTTQYADFTPEEEKLLGELIEQYKQAE